MKQNKVLIDNWSLYDIKELMNNGITYTKTTKIIIKKNIFQTVLIPESVIKIKALLTFLTDLVTRDILLIDEMKKKEWAGKFELLDKVNNIGIIQEINKPNTEYDYANINLIKASFQYPDKIKEILNLSRPLIHEHQKILSTIINGSARYLNNSSKIDTPYSPHPLRANFLNQSLFPLKNDANKSIQNWVKNERTEIIENLNEDLNIKIGVIPIDPILIEIIENATTPFDLIKVALEMRNSYKKFRLYLSKYQNALDRGNIKELIEHKKLLDEIHNKVVNYKNPEKYGKFSISLNLGIFKYNNSYSFVNEILFKKGIRATLQKAILKENSIKTIEKLLKMFDINNEEFKRLLLAELNT